MNCCMGGDWGEEEREDILFFLVNRELFEVKVVVKRKKFKVWLLIFLFNEYLKRRYIYIFVYMYVLKYLVLLRGLYEFEF